MPKRSREKHPSQWKRFWIRPFRTAAGRVLWQLASGKYMTPEGELTTLPTKTTLSTTFDDFGLLFPVRMVGTDLPYCAGLAPSHWVDLTQWPFVVRPLYGAPTNIYRYARIERDHLFDMPKSYAFMPHGDGLRMVRTNDVFQTILSTPTCRLVSHDMGGRGVVWRWEDEDCPARGVCVGFPNQHIWWNGRHVFLREVYREAPEVWCDGEKVLTLTNDPLTTYCFTHGLQFLWLRRPDLLAIESRDLDRIVAIVRLDTMQLVADAIVQEKPQHVVWRDEATFDVLDQNTKTYRQVDLVEGTHHMRLALPNVLVNIVREYMVGF